MAIVKTSVCDLILKWAMCTSISVAVIAVVRFYVTKQHCDNHYQFKCRLKVYEVFLKCVMLNASTSISSSTLFLEIYTVYSGM